VNTLIAEMNGKIAAQAVQIPSIYGRVDFSIVPERFAAEPGADTELGPEFRARRPELLANEEQVARIKAYTMHGDPVADAYAALSPQYGFHQLIVMLEDACAHGVENVPSAPPELVRFIQEMERFPAWLNMKLIEQGARVERNGYAHRAPFVIRGGLIATFMNKYSALPMALTGSLSSKTAGRRVHETATFFTTTVMPGALDRYGAGFKAAAMVRLMHSMVRFNILHRGDHWDVKTYGIPIPQVDQMPVGFVSIFPDALKALRQGRTAFTPAERARVELARYRCFLLGLPEELLVDTPQGVVDLMLTRFATLRKGFDDTCKALVHATISADLTPDHSWRGRLHAWLESGFFKMFFLKHTMRGDEQAAARVGVQIGLPDYIGAAAASIVIAATMTPYAIAAHIPLIRDVADRSLVRKLTRLLASYGHAEFTTNAANYRPAAHLATNK
jgi:ER-bound oxygenase mpaB/B'/Rubber oxygenase, catalytic domain